MISQVIAYQVSEAKEIEDTLQSEMVKFAQEKGLDLLVVAFTSILENGSVFYAAGDIADVVAEAFPNHFEEEHSFQEDILSRKIRLCHCFPGQSSILYTDYQKRQSQRRLSFYSVSGMDISNP